MHRHNLKSQIFYLKNRYTTLKKRYKANNKSLFRLSNITSDNIPPNIENKIIEAIKKLKNIDGIIFSDFNYGLVTPNLIYEVSNFAIKNKIHLFADNQSSSQIGDISIYKNMSLISPTEREARISTRNMNDGLVVMAEKLRKLCEPKNLIIKLGADGVLIHKSDGSSINSDQIPALNVNPVDVSGAGDSLLVGTALMLTLGSDIYNASFFGSIMASIQVSREGNIPIKIDEIKNLIYDFISYEKK